MLVESDRRGALHNRIKEDLNTKVVSDIKQWQKDTFHKVSEAVSQGVNSIALLKSQQTFQQTFQQSF